MLDILEKYHKDGLLLKQTHPNFDLTIWNYSPKVQYERLWDDITMQCRGLVTNSKGHIVARPFKKFFNYEEHKPEDIPNEHYEVFEKMDGSLGILFNYEDEWIMATRGSFTSPQAIKGKKILDKHDISPLRKDNTYLFEIIYPENRIVVDYGNEEKLVVLGAIHTETGDEVPYNSLFTMSGLGFEIVRLWKTWGEGYDLLQEEISKEKEGYVIRFKNGFRMKIKGDEYKRLHRILTNISNRDIWEYLKDGKPLDEILDKVPDEFYNWVKETKDNLLHQFKTIDTDYTYTYKTLININGITERKKFADYAKSYKNSSILFAMLDNKDYKQIIWKLIYPTYSKPFKNDEN
jgi:RNA ligase